MSRSKTVLPSSLVKPDSGIEQDALEFCHVAKVSLRKLVCRCKLMILTVIACGLSGNVLGEGTISVGGTTSAARINIQVLIPNVIALQVGSTGNTVDTLTWESTIEVGGVPITLANQDWDGTTPGTTSPLPDGVTTSPDITQTGPRWRAQVRVFALGGDVTIASSASNGDFLQSTAGHQIALSNITVAGPGNLPHPNSLNGGSSTVLSDASGVVNRNGRWGYRLTTASTLAAGTYQSTITYTATIL
jgi:hypothetical protein